MGLPWQREGELEDTWQYVVSPTVYRGARRKVEKATERRGEERKRRRKERSARSLGMGDQQIKRSLLDQQYRIFCVKFPV